LETDCGGDSILTALEYRYQRLNSKDKTRRERGLEYAAVFTDNKYCVDYWDLNTPTTENLGTNHLSQGPGCCTVPTTGLSLQFSPTYGILPSDKGTGFTFGGTHL
jgi:hypothetical protein